jgi:hypothetical protein
MLTEHDKVFYAPTQGNEEEIEPNKPLYLYMIPDKVCASPFVCFRFPPIFLLIHRCFCCVFRVPLSSDAKTQAKSKPFICVAVRSFASCSSVLPRLSHFSL